jgi:SAM-dependent methyltransferase
MMKVYRYKGNLYPEYLKSGNANAFIEPFANYFCKGEGLDIGGFFKCTFPGARPINILNGDEFDAYHLPDEKYDYIFSSHTLEHLHDCVDALKCWKGHLKENGVLFLYLPHPDMEYWLPQNNRKHLHLFHPEDIHKLLKDLGFKHILRSERDLYWSFAVVGMP